MEDLQTRLQNHREEVVEEELEEPQDKEAEDVISDLRGFAGLDPPRETMPSGGACFLYSSPSSRA